MGLVVFLLHFLPKLLLSKFIALLFRLRLPSSLQVYLSSLFVQLTAINMSEAEKPLAEYVSIEELFSRRLRAGVRTATSEFCSPVDGTLSSSQSPSGILGFQAKGYYYSLRELIYGVSDIEFDFEPAWYMTFYLSPRDYHRVHAPCTGSLSSMRWFAGDRWSVSAGFRQAVTRLYVRNERKAFHFYHPESGGRFFLVMIAALGVGNMVVTANENAAAARKFQVDRQVFSPVVQMQAGDELGYFTFGSSVIMVVDKVIASKYDFAGVRSDTPIKVGDSLLQA